MRLRRLDLTRYGRFTDHRLDFGAATPGAPDFHIVYGLNEAGKSTSLSGFLDLLFGIEQKSRYDFLHPYSAMEIGAVLEIDGAERHLVRRKQRTGSLTDGSGQAVNEAVLAGALGGLSRESYRAMFSLDDETLEAGGEAILQSRGDLGELLFSASAGLAGISAALTRAQDEADAIHRKQARSTAIYALRQRIEALDAKRREIDTAASAHNALAADLAKASEGYEAAVGELGTLRRRWREIDALLRALPRLREHEALEAALGAEGAPPRPPAAWRDSYPRLLTESARVEAALRRVESDRARIEAERGGEREGDAILALQPRWRALEGERARALTAEDDLPRRRRELEAAEAHLAQVLTLLGAPDGTEAGALVLPAPLLGTLRARIDARLSLEQKLDAALREKAEAEHRLTLAETAGKAAVAEGFDPAALAALDGARALARRSAAAGRLAQGAGEEARRRRVAAARLQALHPWTGDAPALRALHLPEGERVATWRARLTEADRREGEALNRMRDAETEARLAATRLDALERSAGAIDDRHADELRRERDAAWTAHRAALTGESAVRFEALLSADDALSQRRLAQAREVGELRQLAGTLATARAGAERWRELADDARAERARLAAEIAAALPPDLTESEADCAALLGCLDQFSRRRAEALEALAALEEAQAQRESSQREAETLRDALTAALRALGRELVSEDPAILSDAADALLTEAAEAGARRAAVEREIAQRRLDLDRRRRDAEAAGEAAAQWAEGWLASIRESGLAERLGGRLLMEGESFAALGSMVGALREMLPVLADLPARLRAVAELRHRVETMEENRRVFGETLDALVAASGLTFAETDLSARAERLATEIERAERRAEAARRRDAELARLKGEEDDLVDAQARLAAEAGAMIATFGVDTLAEVGPCLEAAAERSRREARLAEWERDLLADLGVASLIEARERLAETEAEALETERASLDARLKDLEARRETLFRAKSDAADALERIGGDDAVARLMGERRVAILEMEELAVRALRLRAGALIAGEALRLYRDRHRSAMMDRASQAFGTMTRGDYVGLATQADKERETLIGLTRAGGSRLAMDMSKGTRFQLYLALRLAGYEEFARARAPVPFLADDIMETFDEPRSEEVLRLLAGLSRHGQVVYLTHHRHLCDLARTVEPSVRLHEIAS
ncbi:AAA family ATPase [Aureimonas ureilytica]|uniref:AAA family ATPase n=1 Tax=Aureimonas ureilytica TaxID=401562 RepID=UPI00036F5B88|nr:AAA family ATPase [Aureimonas ureilytica]